MIRYQKMAILILSSRICSYFVKENEFQVKRMTYFKIKALTRSRNNQLASRKDYKKR